MCCEVKFGGTVCIQQLLARIHQHTYTYASAHPIMQFEAVEPEKSPEEPAEKKKPTRSGKKP